MTYSDFFKIATGHDHLPYNWQERLATSEACESRLIDIPTGLGKTAGVVLAWLWNRLKVEDGQQSSWPRRLVYCLPMRTLVEQTEDETQKWIQNLWMAHDSLNLSKTAIEELRWLSGNDDSEQARSPIVLMGGEDLSLEKREWDLYPERSAILIGTQDMLLSRALNRGYGMSRYRWPMHFALLNNDALWIMDEVQLMGVGVETSAQLQGLRKKLGLLNDSACWWMSATLSPNRLETPDFDPSFAKDNVLCLGDSDMTEKSVTIRTDAKKEISFSELSLHTPKTEDVAFYIKALAAKVADIHESGSLTLVILNRVTRAQEFFNELQKANLSQSISLIHSRFRPKDRAEHMRLLENPEGGILVATQAIEAGLDISARHLFTELAPWSSLVQRFGRCNRDGKQPNGGTIHWIDLNAKDTKQMERLALPYSTQDLERARAALKDCNSAAHSDLKLIKVEEDAVICPILRRKDLLDLFDTTADISGQDIDISPYVRDGHDTDIEVYWREIAMGAAPTDDIPKPERNEICRVSIGAFRTFVKATKSNRIWRWRPQTKDWETIKSDRSPIPGMTYLLAADVGGYSSDLGWTGNKKPTVQYLGLPSVDSHEANDDNTSSLQRKPETLTEHTQKVLTEIQTISNAVVSESHLNEALKTAALWHDVGKAHAEFQKMLFPDAEPATEDNYMAKSGGDGRGRCKRKRFRHELASALAWLDATKSEPPADQSLIAFLIAAHHGQVRLSIRSMPDEKGSPKQPDRIFARGVWDGETLPHEGWPAINLCGNVLPTLNLDLSIIALGKGSWLSRTLALRDDSNFGPFRLAALETLLRSADGRGSKIDK
jgi:CRISPR-associated endonuclease/helicase Cas3